MATRADRLSSLSTLLKAQQGWYDDYVVLLHPYNPNDPQTNLCTQHLVPTNMQTYHSKTMWFLSFARNLVFRIKFHL